MCRRGGDFRDPLRVCHPCAMAPPTPADLAGFKRKKSMAHAWHTAFQIGLRGPRIGSTEPMPPDGLEPSLAV